MGDKRLAIILKSMIKEKNIQNGILNGVSS